MKIEVKRYPGRWYSFPWTASVSADGYYGFGCGATRASAIRDAFAHVARQVIAPERTKGPDPIHVEEISA